MAGGGQKGRRLRERGLADLVLVGAAVWTPAPAARQAPGGPGTPGERRRAGAVAVRGGRVAAVGSEAEMRALAGPATLVVELPGGLVVPGFHDAHVHALAGGLGQQQCDLHDLPPGEYLQAVAGYAADHPDAPWVVGDGWLMGAVSGGPRRDQLDRVTAGRPAFLTSTDGHSAWVNQAALALAGVTGDTPDPPRGRIERDPDGGPTGVLHEDAMRLVEELIPPPAPGDLEAAVLRGQAHLHRLGITAWQDASVGPEALAAYQAVAAQGALTARVVAALTWDAGRGLEQVAELVERRRQARGGRLRASAVKVFQDGVVENFTAAMLAPYLDGHGIPTGNSGISMVPAAELAAAVTRLDREGFDVHVHAIGDRAVREALDAVEAAVAANGPRDARHQLAHIQLVHPADRPRFGRLGVIANAQPFWAVLDHYMRDLTLPFLTGERAGWQYPFASLERAGARLAFGSDWTVSTADPLLEMEVAVTRVAPDDRGAEPFLPAERLGLAAALDAFTSGSAHALRLERETGSIEPGKLADLAVLDRDPFAPGAGPVGDARVLATLVEGEPVWSEPALGLVGAGGG